MSTAAMAGWPRVVAALLALSYVAACAPAAPPESAAHARAADWLGPQDAVLALDAAVARASAARPVLAVFGADWCHDSRALAARLARPDLASRFDVVLIDAGSPQTGKARNLDLAAARGVAGITGTPTLLVLGPGGRLLNTPGDARGWRNAASRGDRAIADELLRYLPG